MNCIQSPNARARGGKGIDWAAEKGHVAACSLRTTSAVCPSRSREAALRTIALCSGVTVTSPRVHATAASSRSNKLQHHLPANCLLINQSINCKSTGRPVVPGHCMDDTPRPSRFQAANLPGHRLLLPAACQIDHPREPSPSPSPSPSPAIIITSSGLDVSPELLLLRRHRHGRRSVGVS
jgi:hypothetical protein